jgi:aminomethyltransferase
MSKRTPFFETHVQQGALMVDFGGWNMPLHYGSQIEEHHQVRQDAGVFDVSHMGIVELEGERVQAFLRYLLANNIDKLKTAGRALYSCMLNHEGGVIDDLIVYFISPGHYRLVINAGTTEKDLQWIKKEAVDFSVEVTHRLDLAMLAVQGPQARKKVGMAFPELNEQIQMLKPFHFFIRQELLIARTGYTGEDGVEIIFPAAKAPHYWTCLQAQNIYPIGLGARDTLRLEAGLNLYGQDMDETVSPLESNLDWTVAFEPSNRKFIGREALEVQKQKGVERALKGLILLDKGVLRHHQTVWAASEQVGIITSGSFSPSLKQSIAFARVLSKVKNECSVDIRGKQLKAKIVQPPFMRREKNE